MSLFRAMFSLFQYQVTFFGHIFHYLDSNAVKREEEAIKIDELNVAQIKELRDKVKETSFLLIKVFNTMLSWSFKIKFSIYPNR